MDLLINLNISLITTNTKLSPPCPPLHSLTPWLVLQLRFKYQLTSVLLPLLLLLLLLLHPHTLLFLPSSTLDNLFCCGRHRRCTILLSKTTLSLQPSPFFALDVFASCMAFGIIVTCFAWSVHLLVLLKRPTRYASKASWRARRAVICIHKSDFMSQAISWTRRWKGAFLSQRSVFFWYLRISQRATVTVPGHQRWGFFKPPVHLSFRAAFVASWMHGAFPLTSWPACGLLCSGHCPIVNVVISFVFLCVCFVVLLWHQISTIKIWTNRSLVHLYIR